MSGKDIYGVKRPELDDDRQELWRVLYTSRGMRFCEWFENENQAEGRAHDLSRDPRSRVSIRRFVVGCPPITNILR